MPSSVYVIRLEAEESAESLARKSEKLFDAANLISVVAQNDKVAVKQHFGEAGNPNHIPAEVAKVVVAKIREAGGYPFLTDTTTLYRGKRSNAIDHINVIHEHGFTPDFVGCPAIIADGLTGADRVLVPFDGKHFNQVSIASAAYLCNAAIVMTHVTGHCLAGLGAAIKNMAMGFSSRAGKLAQHHNTHPSFNEENCVACGECARWCPAEAITVEDHAVVDYEKCIGCGECFTVCEHDAVGFKFSESATIFQEKLAEYATGFMKHKKGKVAFMNFMQYVTKDCDCLGVDQERALPDIAVIAGTDPVALDSASVNLVEEAAGRPIFREFWPNFNVWDQINYAESLGLGTKDYELIEVS